MHVPQQLDRVVALVVPARIDWTYLDEDKVALSHFAVVLNDKVYDWTSTQFFGPSSTSPAVWESDKFETAVDAWASAIDRTMTKYGEPRVYVIDFDPTMCTI